MKNEPKAGVFSYSYSAEQKEEILRIREKYAPEQTDNMTRLRRLDERVTSRATTLSLTVGVISTLVMGLGMSCCMVWAGRLFLPGIIIGVIGMAGVASAYPLYQHMVKKEREKIAPEIIRLTDELLK